MSSRRGRYGYKGRRNYDTYDIPENEAVDGNGESTNPFDSPPARPRPTNPFDDERQRKKPNAPTNPFDAEPSTQRQGAPSNPFDEAPTQKSQVPSNPFDGPPAQPPPRTGPVNPFDEEPESTNPFGDERQVEESQPQRQRVPAAPVASIYSQNSSEEEKQAILSGVDTDNKPSRPSSLTNRAKTTGSVVEDSGGKPTFKSWLRKNKDEERRFPNPMNRNAQVAPDAQPIFKKKAKRCTFSKWPFDDYHNAQERFYERLDSKMNEKEGADGVAAVADQYERPSELPDIHTAVQGLSLADFEFKAEERAIGIVSTWLYDAGLIDELLDYKTVVPSSATSVGESSVKTSEGVEIGAQGMPLEGSLRMDNEIDKFRASTHRELSLINARLNDGVAASGSEVQELVDAVNSTKSDLGRLRELSTYISNGGNLEGKSDFMLAKYPHLKAVPNARRNLQRCFRELEFFSQIPATCHRLREELHSGEYTDEEWTTIRNVSLEHVELEILLVEAEAGMKARADGGEKAERRGSPHARSSYVGSASKFNNHEYIDRFLAPHVKNVWELGDEIRIRVLSGIGSAYELALSNPSGMVALVEAVEVYERAADEFKAIHGELRSKSSRGKKKDGLQFTDMRAAALSQICQDFELRSQEVFRQVQMQAADVAEEDEEVDSQLNAILRAASELVFEIEQVKSRIAPCFPPYWGVEVVWSTSVAKVCSRQILQQIGGPDAQKLPGFTVTQLLDLMAWVEHFRETVEEGFPDIGSTDAKKTYYDDRPELLAGDKKEVNVDSARDVIAWANNTLWDVHRLATDEFIGRTREQTEEWVEKAYSADHTKNQSPEGRLTTSLPEDVFALAGVQLRTIQERLPRKSDALVLAAHLIFGQLRLKQVHTRDAFIEDLETGCAAANDFHRMGEKLEDIVEQIKEKATFSDEYTEAQEVSTEELLTLYGRDAVFAAGTVHVYVFEPIRGEIADELFGAEWEEQLTHNDLAKTLVVTLEDFMSDLAEYLEPVLLRKAVDALLRGSIAFYMSCLLTKAEKHNNNKNSVFIDNKRALDRMTGDIKVMRDYFAGLAGTMPALGRVIEREFEFLTTVHELLLIAAGFSASDANDFVIVLHKRICDIEITRNVVGDLWHLVNPAEERTILEQVESLEEELTTIAPTDQNAVHEARDHHNVPGLRLDEVIASLYLNSKRRRPDKVGVSKVVERWMPPASHKDFRQRGEEIRRDLNWTTAEDLEDSD